jgi:hypothetical protein
VICFSKSKPFSGRKGTMSVRRKKFLFAAAAAVTVCAFIQSPSAQNSGNGDNAAGKASMGPEAPATAVSAAADRKADAAMTNPSNSPQTNADKKAAAAMAIQPNSASTK